MIFSQERLTLPDAIDQMRINNTQLKIQRQEIELSQSELSGSLSGFMPRLSASYTGFYTNDPLNAFGFKLQQGRITQYDFDPSLLNDPDALGHFNTKFLLQQPILNADVLAARKALKEKIRAVEYQQQFAESMLSVEITKAYTNLQFLYEARKAVKQGISAYQEVLRNTENMEKQGYAKPSDVLQVKVGLTEVQNKDIEISNTIANLSDYLSWLMGKDTSAIYIPADTLVQNTFAGNDRRFSENRADVLAMKDGLQARNHLITMHKLALVPRVNGFGEFNLYDKGPFGFGSNGFMVGVSLSWDIFNGNETYNKIRQSQIGLHKAESEMQLYIEKQQLEIAKAQKDLAYHQARIQLAETAKAQAAETLRILENRYAEGLEKTSDILVSQAGNLEKQVQYLEAVKDYNLTVIQIEFLSQNTNP